MSTGHKHKNSESVAKNIRFKHELIEQIEQHKDPLIPFGAWVQQACREKLERETLHVSTPMHMTTPVDTCKEQVKIKTTQEQREKLISECYSKGMSAQSTADWLNSQGYLSQRGEFTKNSVRGIAKRMS